MRRVLSTLRWCDRSQWSCCAFLAREPPDQDVAILERRATQERDRRFRRQGHRREGSPGLRAAARSASPPSTTTARSGSSSRCTSSSSSRSIGCRRWRPSIRSGRTSSRSRRCSQGDLKALGAVGERGRRRADRGHACRHDAPTSSRQIVDGLDRDRASIRGSSGPTPSWSTSRCSSCSPTCAPTASRPSSSRAAASSSCGRGPRRSTASRPSRSSAAASRATYELRDGEPVLIAAARDRLRRRQGRQAGRHPQVTSAAGPIAAFGNSDGDLQMLRMTTAGEGPRFGLLVHHDDAEREFAYDRDSPIGKLDKALDAAGPQAGWSYR